MKQVIEAVLKSLCEEMGGEEEGRREGTKKVNRGLAY